MKPLIFLNYQSVILDDHPDEPPQFGSISEYRAHLLPADLIDQFAAHGSQASENPIILAKYYIPSSLARWYATEYHDGTFRGFVTAIDFADWGRFKLSAMEALYGKGKHVILRDEAFTPQPFSEAVLPAEMLCAEVKEITRYTKLRAQTAVESA